MLQGYFLQITNLDFAINYYYIDLVQTFPAIETQQRTLADRATAFLDNSFEDNSSGQGDPGETITGGLTDQVFPLPQNGFRILPSSTALISVLPRVFSDDSPIAPGPNSQPQYEVRGFVRLNAVRPGGYFRNVVSDQLLTPQFRATYLTFGSSGGFNVVGQTQGAVPLAFSGGVAQENPF